MAGALVLAGGGALGVAWETGLVAGLLDDGVDLRSSTRIVGTSAGSIVGARLAAGDDLRETADELEQPGADGALGAGIPGVDPAELAAGFARMLMAFASGDAANLSVTDIGTAALTASAVPEEAYVAWLAERAEVGGEWPESLVVTTIDTATGELVALERSSGAPLAHAVAASCSVPGLFPPVTVGGKRLMDGGVRTVTNAELVLGSDAQDVLVVTTLTGRSPEGTLFATWERRVRREVEALEADGRRVAVVMAEQDDVEAMGFNPMDATRTQLAVAAGRNRGRREAARAELAAWRA